MPPEVRNWDCPCVCEACPEEQRVSRDFVNERGEIETIEACNAEEAPRPAIDEFILLPCAPKDDRERALEKCREQCRLVEDTPERAFQECSAAENVEERLALHDPETDCSEESLYDDGRINVGDAAEIVLTSASQGTFSLLGVSVSTPLSGRTRLFLDGCHDTSEPCDVALADFIGSAVDFEFPGVGDFLPTPVAGLTLVQAGPTRGTLAPDGGLVFADGIRFIGSLRLGGEELAAEIPINGSQLVEARLDVPSRAFSARFVSEGPLGDLTEVALEGIVENFPPQAAVEVVGGGCPAVLSAEPSVDFDGEDDLAAFEWRDASTSVVLGFGEQLLLFEDGEQAVALIAVDRALAHSRADVVVTVENALPEARIDVPSHVECAGPTGTTVRLSAASSFAPDAAPLSRYTWRLAETGDELGEGVEIDVELPLGEHAIELEVEDACGGVDVAQATVVVQDTTPPTLSEFAFEGPLCLWPPNHGYFVLTVEESFDAVITDVCDPEPHLIILDATSSQPDDAEGDGSTVNDVVVYPDHVCLRSERQGGALDGRVYTIHLAAVDASRNVTDPVVEVFVPHDQRPQTRCLEDVELVGEDDPRCEPPPPIMEEAEDPEAGLAHDEERVGHASCASVPCGGLLPPLLLAGLLWFRPARSAPARRSESSRGRK